MDKPSVVTIKSGLSGTSYFCDTPVKPDIEPVRAFLYKPLTSRASHMSSGVLTNTSKNLKTQHLFSINFVHFCIYITLAKCSLTSNRHHDVFAGPMHDSRRTATPNCKSPHHRYRPSASPPRIHV